MQPRMPKLNEVPGDPPSYKKRYQYEDINGSFSQPFEFASEYKEGFAKIQLESTGPILYRDLLGRVSSFTANSGKVFHEFYTGKLAFRKIPLSYWESSIFCKGVKEELIRKEKTKASLMFKQGKMVSKSSVEKRINKSFEYINKMHKKAVAATIKENKKTRKSDDYSAEYDETMAYLNTL